MPKTQVLLVFLMNFSGACSVGNGGCSHICDVNDGEVECSCPNAGLLNPVDEKTCRGMDFDHCST